MKQQPKPFAQDNQYFLTRVKDTHEEDGTTFITLFARLTRGPFRSDSFSKSMWVYIDEVKEEGAPAKMRSLPNGAFTFGVSREVVGEILDQCGKQPHHLWLVTPFYRTSHFRKF